MTRKHFIQFADDIRLSGFDWPETHREIIIRMLKKTNPNFDEGRFRKCAGWSE